MRGHIFRLRGKADEHAIPSVARHIREDVRRGFELQIEVAIHALIFLSAAPRAGNRPPPQP